MTFDGSTTRLYVNGALQSSVSGAFTPATNSAPLWIGRAYGTNYACEALPAFQGYLDEVALFSAR